MTGFVTGVPPALLLFVAAAVCLVLPRRTGYTFATLAALAVVAWVGSVPDGAHLRTTLFGFDVVLLDVDAFSRTVGLAFGYIAAAGTLFAYATDADARQGTYALAYMGASLGAAFAGDWLTLVVFWELMAVCATLLVWHGGGAARRAGFRYAVYHEVGAVFLIAGVLLQYTRTGTFLYGDGFAGLPAVLAAVGIGLNAGFVGLHVWMVDAYPRPHVTASVVLAAFTTKVGAYALVRAFPDGNAIVAYLGGVMVIVGVSMAILQVDVRRLLTYHIVSQVGYMVAGVGVGTGLAVAGAFAHLVNNVLYKSLLFMVAAVVIYRTGEGHLKRLGGLSTAMPVTFVLFLVAAASITGAPGTNGFVSKGMVVDGVEAAGLDLLWWVLVVGAVGTVVSFVKFGYYAFYHGSATGPVSDVTAGQALAMGATAVLCVLLGLVLDPLFAVLPGDASAANPFSPSQFVKAGGLFVAGFVVFGVLRRPLSRIERVPDLDAAYRPLGSLLLGGLVGGTGTLAGLFDRAGNRLARVFTVWASTSGRDRDSTAEGAPEGDEQSGADELGTSVLLVVLALVVVLLALLL